MKYLLQRVRATILGACALSILTAGSFVMPVQAEGNAPAGFDDFVNKVLRDCEVPGACVAIVKDGKVVLTKGYGLRKIGSNEKVDADTIFAIGSCTKAFTSAAIAKLVGEGKLHWDDRVIDYLPQFQVSEPWVTYNFTIRDLLSMRSGLANTDLMVTIGGFNQQQTLDHLKTVPFKYSFRSHFTYVNLMYMTAGEVSHAVTGKTWADYVTKSFLQPLAMTRSSTSITGLDGETNVASPHMMLKGKVIPVEYLSVDSIAAAGAINSTATDMAKWVAMQLAGGSVDQKVLVDKAALEETHTPQMLADHRNGNFIAVLGSTPIQAYCMGWGLIPMEGEMTLQHDGGIDGMRSTTLLVPDKNFGVSVLTNTQYGNGKFSEAIAYRAMEVYLNHEPHDWSAAFLKLQKAADETERAEEKRVEAARVLNTKPSVALDQYAGTYLNPTFGSVTITKTILNASPILHFQAQSPLTFGDMSHWNYDTFKVLMNNPVTGETLIAFNLDTTGKVESFTLDGDLFRRIK